MQPHSSQHFSPKLQPVDSFLKSSLANLVKGALSLDLHTGVVKFDQTICSIFGIPQTDELTLLEFANYLTIKDQDRFLNQVKSCDSAPAANGISLQVSSKINLAQMILLAGSKSSERTADNHLIITAIELPSAPSVEVELKDSAVGIDLLNNNPDVITRWDSNLKLIFANPAFALKAGQPIANLLGKNNLEMGQPSEIARPYMDSLRLAFESGKPQQYYNDFSVDGKLLKYQSSMTPEFGLDGEIKSVLAVAHDITELSKQQLLLAQSEQRLKSLISQAPIATCLFVGKEMVIDVANDLMLGYWGKDRSVIGLPLLDGVPELIGQPFMDMLLEVFHSGVAYEAKSIPAILKVDGKLSTFYFDFTYKPIFDENQNVYGIMDMAVVKYSRFAGQPTDEIKFN